MKKKKNVKSKKRKKHSPKKQQLIRAERKNAFHCKLQHIAAAAGALDVFNLIPRDEKEILFFTRFRPLRVDAVAGQTVPAQLVNPLKKSISDYMKKTHFSIIPGGAKVSLHDYFNAGVTLTVYLRTIEDDAYATAAEVKKGFASYLQCVDAEQEPLYLLFNFTASLAWAISSIDSRLYWFSYDIINKRTIPPVMYECLYINFHRAEPMQINLDGKNRPAYRVGGTSTTKGLCWSSIRPVDLKIDSAFSEMPLEVYAQSHALLRLSERIDFIKIPILHFFLSESLKKVHSIRMKNGRTLVEYRLFSVKVGYLVVDLVNGVALIRTFLFLTNRGTPEGEKLHESMGLEIIEKKYLQIDKLSTFVLTDLKNDKELRKLFTSVGCGCLFELADKDSKIDPDMQQAAAIAEYLGLR